jgi:hypothetical protein
MNKLSDEQINYYTLGPFDCPPESIEQILIELQERRALALLAEAATKEKGGDYPEECELVAVHTGEGWALYAEKDGDVVAALRWNDVYGNRQTADELRLKGFRIE